jgi:hypothetical protein
MGYMPNDLRAVVRMYPELGDLCLLVADSVGLSHPMVDRLFKALVPQSGRGSAVVALYQPGIDYGSHPEGLPAPVSNSVASKFVIVGPPNISLIKLIVAREFPVVCIGQEVALPGVTSLLPDYAGASRLGIETLSRLNHRQIAILSGPFGSTDPATIEMNHGVRAGYDAANALVEAQNVIFGEDTFEHGEASIELLLERPQKPTAVFCFSDRVAAGVLHRAQQMGVQVPEALSVIGFGDAAFAELLHPPLTTVGLPVEEMAQMAVDDLHHRIREEDLSSMHRRVIPCRLIERGSTAEWNPDAAAGAPEAQPGRSRWRGAASGA